MIELDKILKEYTDTELAFLMMYKFESYMPKSQKLITEELNSRGLTQSRLEELRTNLTAEDYKDKELRCPRCFSNKILNERSELWNTRVKTGHSISREALDGIAGRADFVESLTCMICDYVISDPNEDHKNTIAERFINWFKK